VSMEGMNGFAAERLRMPLTERTPMARAAGPHHAPSDLNIPQLLPFEAGRRLREEAALVERFVECYRRQFDAIIRRLNESSRAASVNAGHAGHARQADPSGQSLRLCVEAVSMMLATHGQMARALRQVALPTTAAATTADALPGPPHATRAAA
jgi:hypothetical protein